jgi:phospholipase C
MNGSMQASTYVVKTGDTITKRYPLSLFTDTDYAIEVIGPNGFYRSFTHGNASPSQMETRLSYESHGSKLTGNVSIALRNTSKKAAMVTVTDISYGAKAIHRTLEPSEEASIVMPLKTSHGWYDFTVKTEGSTSEARFAGHVENGEASFSDPLMGGIVQSA